MAIGQINGKFNINQRNGKNDLYLDYLAILEDVNQFLDEFGAAGQYETNRRKT